MTKKKDPTYIFFSVENDGRIREFNKIADMASHYELEIALLKDVIDTKGRHNHIWFRRRLKSHVNRVESLKRNTALIPTSKYSIKRKFSETI